MFNAQQDNPLLARNRRRSQSFLFAAMAAFGLFAAGTLAVSASQPPGGAQQSVAQQTSAPASPETRTASVEANGQQRRTVRVIPLFNTPPNQTGK